MPRHRSTAPTNGSHERNRTAAGHRSRCGIRSSARAWSSTDVPIQTFGSGHAAGGAIAALLAALAGAAAVVWMLAEHRRVNRAEAVWVAEHPGTHVEPPTG